MDEHVPLRGLHFSSYAAAEVGWLLTDLSNAENQSDSAHHDESLALEYQPSAEYHELVFRLLRRSARQIARVVGVITELVISQRGTGVVLASTVRAGVPVGILMRRWGAYAHGVEIDHYAISIKRGRGIDVAALRWLATRYDPARIMFVDAWTGKGGIARELSARLAEPGVPSGFDPALAVLTDPGHCTSLFGTREDLLIPIACLNSTVTGLVSSCVQNHELIRPGDFHGARFYRELLTADVSNLFLDAVSAEFPAVARQVAEDWPEVARSDRVPDWNGWKATEQIAGRYGVGDPNLLVRPGVGETLRVLLSHIPWRVLVNPDAEHELDHVLLLAEQRDVPVDRVSGLPYSSVGLLRPPVSWGWKSAIRVTHER
jgi:hypothetical protein